MKRVLYRHAVYGLMALQSLAVFPKDIVRLIAKMLTYEICARCGATSEEDERHQYCRVVYIAGLDNKNYPFDVLRTRVKRAELMVLRENAERDLNRYCGTLAEESFLKLIEIINSAILEFD